MILTTVMVVGSFMFALADTDGTMVNEVGCPDSNVIKPCTCSFAGSTFLTCQGIQDEEELRDIFVKSARHQFTEVHLQNSIMQFLPFNLFDNVQVKKLYLKNITLVQLFDDIPENLDVLNTLFVEDTYIFRGMTWDLLEPLTNLRTLSVYYNSIPVLDEDFSNSVTKDLKQLGFYDTQTAVIKPGTFVDFVNLDRIAIDACELKVLSRDMFPMPFNVRVLYFNNNKLRAIPDNLFTYMPNLQTLGLRNNQITVLPASAFVGSMNKLVYFMLEGNPLKCDCRMLWLIQQPPSELKGQCDDPYNFKDRSLKELNPKMLICPVIKKLHDDEP